LILLHLSLLLLFLLILVLLKLVVAVCFLLVELSAQLLVVEIGGRLTLKTSLPSLSFSEILRPLLQDMAVLVVSLN
jgi:hypothetical protein